jgi:RNA polymerase sigma factor (sigma-70 family)
MATGRMSEVVRHLRRAVLLREGEGLSDGQLLEGYLRLRDDAALAALVRRHGPMVWGVCRRVLRSYHDAEDAFQATFLVLVRKAGSIVPRGAVANWLYGVARRTALKARATAARRRGRESQVADAPEPAAPERDLGRDLRPLLDQELSRLPERYRAVLVLCDLGGKTRKEAARHLGVPEGTVAGRLARARAMLAKRLARHGLAVSGGALAVVVSQQAAPASVPPSVVSSTVKAVTLFAAGRAAAAGAVSVQLAGLTEGVLKAMLLTKLRAATAGLLVVALALGGLGAGGLLHRAQVAEPGEGSGRTGGGEQRGQSSPPPKPSLESLEKQLQQLQRAVDELRRGSGGGAPVSSSPAHARLGMPSPPKYKGIFIKMLAAVAEHCEQITYANQYDGRIEARTVDANRSGVFREASVSLLVDDDGGLSIIVSVRKIRATGDKLKVVGRDAEWERAIMAGLDVHQKGDRGSKP